MQLSSILTVLDKPKHPQSALTESIRLQQLAGAHLDLVAFRWDTLIDHGAFFDAKQRRQLHHKVHLECAAWQDQLLATYGADPERSSTRMIWSKDIAGWLADELSESPQDLVVKTVHRSKILMYTPTDWQLLRTCTTPILFTTSKSQKRSNRILVALDFRHDDQKHQRLNSKVLQAAQCIADLTGAELHCIYAIEISQVLRDLDVVNARLSKKKILEASVPFIERALHGYQIPKSRRYFPVGKAGQLVNAKAHQLNADVIVMGTSAHRIQHTIGLGNTAERILTKARCDVLAVHP